MGGWRLYRTRARLALLIQDGLEQHVQTRIEDRYSRDEREGTRPEPAYTPLGTTNTSAGLQALIDFV
jgi:hypothetical protein